jgi:hypothetical protein
MLRLTFDGRRGMRFGESWQQQTAGGGGDEVATCFHAVSE